MKKLDTTITINKPVKEVWDYMDNPDNLPKWLNGFERYEFVSGEYGKVGAKGIHHYNENGRKYTMNEEVVEMREYEFIKLNVTSKSLDMIIENEFTAVDQNTTTLRAVAEFTRASLFMKVMMKLFMPIKKAQAQHDEQLVRFKQLVEQQ